jgi:hypothetical protein
VAGHTPGTTAARYDEHQHTAILRRTTDIRGTIDGEKRRARSDQRLRRPVLIAVKKVSSSTASTGPFGFLLSRMAPVLASSTQLGPVLLRLLLRQVGIAVMCCHRSVLPDQRSSRPVLIADNSPSRLIVNTGPSGFLLSRIRSSVPLISTQVWEPLLRDDFRHVVSWFIELCSPMVPALPCGQVSD